MVPGPLCPADVACSLHHTVVLPSLPFGRNGALFFLFYRFRAHTATVINESPLCLDLVIGRGFSRQNIHLYADGDERAEAKVVTTRKAADRRMVVADGVARRAALGLPLARPPAYKNLPQICPSGAPREICPICKFIEGQNLP